MTTVATFRCGYAAIVGEPNVGKSTLLNAVLRQKLSIVARKPQTTRQRVLGILSTDEAQVIFLDTPGLISPKYLLQEEMLKHAEGALTDADVVVVLTDVSRSAELPAEVLQRISPLKARKPLILVLNKVDKVYKPTVLPMIDRFAKLELFQEIIPLSALKRDNLEAFVRSVEQALPVHPPLYPTDIISEQPERFFVAEFVREKIFEQFREEIPYSTAVDIREFREQKDKKKTFISADIIVERDSQKGILIGSGGESLKRVGSEARRDIERFLERAVYLELTVKVREHWRDDEHALKALGYRAE